MARMTTLDRNQKQSDCKKLFLAEISLQDIKNITGVTVKTLSKWRDEFLWEDEKELMSIKPSEIRKLTLKQAVAISKGEPLPYKSDEISKIVAAFDRITDHRKIAVYSMESIDSFSSFMLKKAGKAKGKKREEILHLIKNVRPYFDDFITELLQHD